MFLSLFQGLFYCVCVLFEHHGVYIAPAVFQGSADRVLIYLTLYISECLKKLQKVRVCVSAFGSDCVSPF